MSSNSTFKKTVSADVLYTQFVEYLRDGYVTVEFEKITFDHNSSSYTLDNTNIIEVISIEGIDKDGFYIPPSGQYNGKTPLVENIDFSLAYSGALSVDGNNRTLYDTVSFTNKQYFKDQSTVFISYKYYDADKVTNITNFQAGSVAAMLARGLANNLANLYNINERTYNAGFVSLAEGQDLDNHADGWGLTRTQGTKATGMVRVSIASGGTQFTVNTNNVFVSFVGGQNLLFKPISVVEGSSFTVPVGGSSDFIVQSINNGVRHNVGANSIKKLYSSSVLANEISENTYITVTNPITNADGTLNTFTGGTDKETDDDLRTRIYNKATKLGRSSLPAMKAALKDLANVADVKILDYETNPDLDADTFYVYAVGDEGVKLLTDTSSVSAIRDQVNEYRPIGTTFSILSPMGVYIDFSGTATLFQEDSNDVTEITNQIQTNITNYINKLKIGEDVIYSQLIEEAMKVPNVYKFDIDQLNYTEFATTPASYDNTTYKIYDNTTGTPVERWFSQPVKFLSQFKSETKLYDGNTTYTMSNSDIQTTPSPYVLLAINDGNDNYIRDPSYTTDWYSSNSSTTITINTSAGSGVSRTLATNVDYLKYFYETRETKSFDKIRVRLGNNFTSSQSGTVELIFGSGATNYTTQLGSGTITVTSGVQDYEITLDGGSITVTQPDFNFYVILSGVSAPSGTYISLPVSASGTAGALSTILTSGTPGTDDYDSGAIVPNVTPLVHTIITTSGTADIPIEKNAQTPDIAVVYDVDIGYNIIERD
jgi:uncharacterized phage protein gp47/JayE